MAFGRPTVTIPMKRQGPPNNQVLPFPSPAEVAGDSLSSGSTPETVPRNTPFSQTLPDIVVSGSFRKDLQGLRNAFEELKDLGFTILSPTNTNIVSERDGFAFLKGEETYTPGTIEERHLDAIRRAGFVWLHAPEGYLGPSAALEIGFARASGIPVYSRVPLREKCFQSMVTVVESPHEAASQYVQHPQPPLPAVHSFQAYYARAAIARGYTNESARDTLLLMVEEFGELARALRKRAKLRRDSTGKVGKDAHELADIFIYVIHMANVLGIDLAAAVQEKEEINIKRFLAR